MIGISRMAAAVQPSATIAAGAKARQLKAAGVKVYDLSLGEPDFDTPQHICDAAHAAARAGQTHYTATSGTPAVKAAIARWYARVYGFECKPEQIIVSNGAKHSLHTALAATVGPGDEVIIPTPYWVSYGDLVSMTGATPILVPTNMESGFKLSPAQLRSAPHSPNAIADDQLPLQPDWHGLHESGTRSARGRRTRERCRDSE